MEAYRVSSPALFHESIEDALREVVQALGGNKTAGAQLRPELSADDAGKWVSDCMNPDRAQFFRPAQVIWLMREGRRIGCHAAANFACRESGYADPTPIEPDDERARIERELTEALKQVNAMAERLLRNGARAAA